MITCRFQTVIRIMTLLFVNLLGLSPEPAIESSHPSHSTMSSTHTHFSATDQCYQAQTLEYRMPAALLLLSDASPRSTFKSFKEFGGLTQAFSSPIYLFFF